MSSKSTKAEAENNQRRCFCKPEVVYGKDGHLEIKFRDRKRLEMISRRRGQSLRRNCSSAAVAKPSSPSSPASPEAKYGEMMALQCWRIA